LAEEQARAEAIKNTLAALDQPQAGDGSGGRRESMLSNITMEPWRAFEPTDHIRMGSREEREAAAAQVRQAAPTLELRAPPAVRGRNARGAGAPAPPGAQGRGGQY
ncbi:hypothetical protein HK405_010604, partial [Cladochytrium tenue]